MGGAIISESGGGIIPLRGAASSRNWGRLPQKSAPMHDLMMIAALTGARLEAVVDLRARDCGLDCHLRAAGEGEVRQRGANPSRAR